MEKTYHYKDKELLKRFIDEQFDINGLINAGFLTKKMKGDYQAIADRISAFFGYENVYEYGHREEPIRAHLSYAGNRPDDEPFVTEIRSIYE